MGAVSCKNTKSHPEPPQKEDKKNITIGVFGLDDAGKTSTVRAIEGDPTDDVDPTVGSYSKMVPFSMHEKADNTSKNKNQQSVRMIDVSGDRKFRQSSWSKFYDEIHGLIFVVDASEKSRFKENEETLEDLLENSKLKDKPILILANKIDRRGAVNNEYDLKRRLNIEKLKTKHKIEFCTATPQDDDDSVDESIRKGFTWLIRTIDENYTQLNSLVTKAKTNLTSRKSNSYDSDEDDSDNKHSKAKTNNYSNKNPSYQSKITNEKLPSINTNKNKPKAYSDNDDDDDDDVKPSTMNDYNNNKRKVTGITKNNDTSTKRSSSTEPKAFRSTYESFPEENHWSLTSTLKKTMSDDMLLPKLSTKTSITSDTKRRNMSPLVHDTKSFANGLLSKRDNYSDDEDSFKQQKSKPTIRFDNSTLSSNKFSSSTKKTSSNIYDDDDDDDDDDKAKNRFSTSKPYSRYDNDENNFSKTSTNKSNALDNFKSYQREPPRLNLDNNYRGTSAKASSRSKYDDDDDDDDDDDRTLSSTRKKNNSKFDDDDDDDNYSKSRSNPRSTYNNDYTKSKKTNHSKYDDDDDDDNNYNYKSSSSKPINLSKYDNDDRPYSSSKPTLNSKFEDDDYPASSNKTNYSSSYNKNNYGGAGGGSSSTRSRFDDDDDFFTSKGESNSSNRFQKRTNYDS